MLNKKAMGMHWYILIISFFISVGVIMYYEFIDSPIPKVGEYSAIMSKTLEKESIIPSLIERVMEDINKQSTVRFNDHIEFLGLLDSDCNGTYENNLGWSSFLIPREAESIATLTSGELIPEEELGESTYCHMDTIRAKNKFRIIFTNNYNYFRRHNTFSEDFDLFGLQYDFTNPSEESGEFFIEITVRATNPGLIFQINKEDGSMLGSYRMRPGFKLPVDYDFNAFDSSKEMCLFVAGCADFTDVLTRYPQLEDSPYYYKIREEPCEYYSYLGSVCTAADIADATDNFGKYYETDRFLCSGDCIPPPCSLGNEALTQYGFPTGCRAEDCGSYYSCFKTDCTCSSDDLKACVGRTDPSTRAFCKPYCSSYYYTEDGDPLTNCRTDCNSYFNCNTPASTPDCYCPSSSTEQCEGSCVPYCSTPQAPANTHCQELSCSDYHNCQSIVPSDKCYCPTTPRSQDINKCEAIDEAEESCPSCWCPGWTDSGACGDLRCDWNKVPQSRTCMPGGCDSETKCDTRDSCDCSLDAEADTKCMPNLCGSYASTTCDSTSDCGCEVEYFACKGDCTSEP